MFFYEQRTLPLHVVNLFLKATTFEKKQCSYFLILYTVGDIRRNVCLTRIQLSNKRTLIRKVHTDVNV